MRREIEFTAGYDHREGSPTRDVKYDDLPDGKQVGCGGSQIRFYLIGDEGAVQFVMYTDWMPSDVVDDTRGPRVEDHTPREWMRGTRWEQTTAMQPRLPIAADLGYHSPTPHYDNQPAMDCTLLPQGECYYDGSGLNAEPVMAALFKGGSDAAWDALEDYYAETFGTIRERITP